MSRPKPIVALLSLAVAAALIGCGGDSEPDPSIPVDDAQVLISTVTEVEDNVEVGSCLVAADKVQEFQAELAELPSDVNQDVLEALQRGALNLGDLVENDCEGQVETTTEETEPTTETQPTTPTTPGGSGGIEPGL